jgi:hypothetical protein
MQIRESTLETAMKRDVKTPDGIIVYLATKAGSLFRDLEADYAAGKGGQQRTI